MDKSEISIEERAEVVKTLAAKRSSIVDRMNLLDKKDSNLDVLLNERTSRMTMGSYYDYKFNDFINIDRVKELVKAELELSLAKVDAELAKHFK